MLAYTNIPRNLRWEHHLNPAVKLTLVTKQGPTLWRGFQRAMGTCGGYRTTPGSFIPLCGFWRLNSGHQVWQQVPLNLNFKWPLRQSKSHQQYRASTIRCTLHTCWTLVTTRNDFPQINHSLRLFSTTPPHSGSQHCTHFNSWEQVSHTHSVTMSSVSSAARPSLSWVNTSSLSCFNLWAKEKHKANTSEKMNGGWRDSSVAKNA